MSQTQSGLAAVVIGEGDDVAPAEAHSQIAAIRDAARVTAHITQPLVPDAREFIFSLVVVALIDDDEVDETVESKN